MKDSSIRILIADDDSTSREILKVSLLDWGYCVATFSDGTSALEELDRDSGYAVAILDWTMPGCNGVDICQYFKEKQSLNTYLILLTSKYGLDDVVNGFNSGAHDYMMKPFEPEELHARVQVGVKLYTMHHQIETYASSMESLAMERAKQLLHADRLSTLGVLSAGMAHEINNPLSFIHGNSEFLSNNWHFAEEILLNAEKNGTSNPQAIFFQKEFLSTIESIGKGVNRISKIVDSLKLYARKESGERKPCSLVNMIDQALELCSNRLKNGITVHFDQSQDFEISGDIQQLEQVFVNLIVNASDALMHCEQKTISISLYQTELNVIVMVRDSGFGFSQQVLSNLFTPFYTTKEIGKGTGLGLSICEGIIQDHGGGIRAYNGTPTGACFELTFPRI